MNECEARSIIDFVHRKLWTTKFIGKLVQMSFLYEVWLEF